MNQIITITNDMIAERAATLRAKAPARREYTMPHPELKGTDTIKETCWRCRGEGRLQQFHYVEGGRCFTCEGSGAKEIKVSSVRSRLRREVKNHNDMVDSMTVNAEDTARLEIFEEVAELNARIREEQEREARAKADQLAAEKAELAAEDLADNFPEGMKITDLPVTLKETYTFYKDAWNTWEEPVLTVCAVFAAENGVEFAWYSSGLKVLDLVEKYDADAAPLQLTIRGTVKRHQERKDGTARVILTRVTYKQ